MEKRRKNGETTSGKTPKKKTIVIVVVIVTLILLVGGTAGFFLLRRKPPEITPQITMTHTSHISESSPAPSESPAPSSPAPAPGCVTSDNTDFHGGDLLDELYHVTDTSEECCDMCKTMPGCKRWTWGMDEDENKCWLKGDDVRIRNNEKRISGTMIDGTNCVVYPNLDFNKGDILDDGEEEHVESVQDCCNMCRDRPGCTRWTYATDKEDAEPNCWLKGPNSNDDIESKCNTNRISGCKNNGNCLGSNSEGNPGPVLAPDKEAVVDDCPDV